MKCSSNVLQIFQIKLLLIQVGLPILHYRLLLARNNNHKNKPNQSCNPAAKIWVIFRKYKIWNMNYHFNKFHRDPRIIFCRGFPPREGKNEITNYAPAPSADDPVSWSGHVHWSNHMLNMAGRIMWAYITKLPHRRHVEFSLKVEWFLASNFMGKDQGA